MEADVLKPTPVERLQTTRRAIAGQLARKLGNTINTEQEVFVAAAADDNGVLASTRRALRGWWLSHPVHNAVDVAKPLLEDYAQHRPYQVIGIAAGAGAALTLLKSWRVLSVTGVVLALVKTSDLKSTARYFMRPARARTKAPARSVGAAGPLASHPVHVDA